MNSIISKLVCMLMAIMLICTSISIVCAAEDDRTLRFGDDGKFTILQITDPQDDQHPAYEMLKLIKASIELANPDLVVLTGDIVEDKRVGRIGIDDEGAREGVCVYKGKNIKHDETLANVKAASDAVFSIINDAGIPFAVTQGNNDYKCDMSKEEWIEIYESYEKCLVKDESDDKADRIDYSLNILASDSDVPVFNLYMMDTKGSSVTDEQIEWYEQDSDSLKQKAGETVKAFVFQHIPVDEVGNLFVQCRCWDDGAKLSGTKWYRLSEGSTGRFASVQIPGGSSDQFKSWKKQGDVIGAYFGHWHNDGYTGTYDGIELGLTYGSEFEKAGPYGVRVITLDESNISQYENDLYIYNNGTLEKQEKTGYTVYDNFFQAIFARLHNFFTNLIK